MSECIMPTGWREWDCFEREPYTEREAFSWIVENAASHKKTVRIRRTVLYLSEGDLIVTLGTLARQFQWKRARVYRFLQRLKERGLIKNAPLSSDTVCDTVSDTVSPSQQTAISVCKYVEIFGRQNDKKSVSDTVCDTVSDTVALLSDTVCDTVSDTVEDSVTLCKKTLFPTLGKSSDTVCDTVSDTVCANLPYPEKTTRVSPSSPPLIPPPSFPPITPLYYPPL